MLLVIDIGNTHAVGGLYRGKRLVKTWRVPTVRPVKRLVAQLLRPVPTTIDGACISSVVPWVDRSLERGIIRRSHCNVINVTYQNVGMSIVKCRKSEVGADRLVNACAAYNKYRRALIIVDFGTATTFDVITSKGEYAGGAIAPGICLANRSLSDYTAKLPRVPIRKTRHAICYDTVSSMQSGVFHGYVGLVDHLVRKIKREMPERPKVIATGGLAPLISPVTEVIDVVHLDLTLEGLRIVWCKNLHQARKKF